MGRKRPAKAIQPAGSKKAGAASTPTGGKTPSFATEPAHDHPRVIWRFAQVDIEGRWGWKRLALGADDVDDLWELRLAGKQRIWGFRRGSLFFFLWWDPEHEICLSTKKRT